MIEIVLRDSSSNMYVTCDDGDAVRPASIPLNCNFEGSLHVDGNNFGVQIARLLASHDVRHERSLSGKTKDATMLRLLVHWHRTGCSWCNVLVHRHRTGCIMNVYDVDERQRPGIVRFLVNVTPIKRRRINGN